MNIPALWCTQIFPPGILPEEFRLVMPPEDNLAVFEKFQNHHFTSASVDNRMEP
jgi:hypothetical protein